jgi:chaperonin GroES
MKAFGNRLIVEKKNVERIRASGLIVPETKDERAQEGTILSVGPRVLNPLLRDGAHVYFGKWSADGINGILCLREQDVLGVLVNGGIRPIKRVLVKMIPIGEDHRTNMGPTLRAMGMTIEDKKKHWDHKYRRAMVVGIDPAINAGVCVGDVVVFNGAAGFTLDGDVMDEDDKYDEPLKGESFRWLKAKELDAIDLTLATDPTGTENSQLLARS